MSLFTKDTVAYYWRYLIHASSEARQLSQPTWRSRALHAIAEAQHRAQQLGMQPKTIEGIELLWRIPPKKEAKLSSVEGALQVHDIVEAIALAMRCKNAHERQRGWLSVAWYWLHHQNIVGAQLILERLTLPQMEEERLLLQAYLFYQTRKHGVARDYLAALEPNIRRYSFLRGLNQHQERFLSRALNLKAALFVVEPTPKDPKQPKKKALTYEQANFLCQDLYRLREFYLSIPEVKRHDFLEEQDLIVWKHLHQAFSFVEIWLQCEAAQKVFSKNPIAPNMASTPEEAYWLGAIGRRDCAPSNGLRAFFDAGFSTREHHATENLFRASKAEIERAVLSNRPSKQITARLECLRQLKSSKVERWAIELFQTTESKLDEELFTLIASQNPRRAKALFYENFHRIGTEPKLAESWIEKIKSDSRWSLHFLYCVATYRLGAKEGLRWLSALLRVWWRTFGSEPSSSALDTLQNNLTAMSPAQHKQLSAQNPEETAEAFIQSGLLMMEQLSTLEPKQLLERLIKDPEAFQLSQCFTPGAQLSAWSEARWKSTLTALQQQINAYQTDHVMLRELTQKLTGDPRKISDALLSGVSPTKELAQPLPIDESISIRYLHKARDLFSFLRFADAVTCCFSSMSHSGVYYNQRWIFDLWRDPMSFCFLIEQEERPFGFVFGSFGEQRGAPVVLLNGIYIKRQKQALRENILLKIEESLCKPLNIKRVAVANRFAGRGFIPESYQAKTEQFVRLRALRDTTGARVNYVYDDISNRTNEPYTAYDLYWRTI